VWAGGRNRDTLLAETAERRRGLPAVRGAVVLIRLEIEQRISRMAALIAGKRAG